MKKIPVVYQYVEKQKKDGIFKDVTTSQLEFINHYNIGNLITDKDVVLDPAFNKIITSFVTDLQSGEHFYLLNTSKAGTF